MFYTHIHNILAVIGNEIMKIRKIFAPPLAVYSAGAESRLEIMPLLEIVKGGS